MKHAATTPNFSLDRLFVICIFERTGREMGKGRNALLTPIYIPDLGPPEESKKPKISQSNPIHNSNILG